MRQIYMAVIDEIDSMLPIMDDSTGNPTTSSVINQFLSEIDRSEENILNCPFRKLTI